MYRGAQRLLFLRGGSLGDTMISCFNDRILMNSNSFCTETFLLRLLHPGFSSMALASMDPQLAPLVEDQI